MQCILHASPSGPPTWGKGDLQQACFRSGVRYVCAAFAFTPGGASSGWTQEHAAAERGASPRCAPGCGIAQKRAHCGGLRTPLPPAHRWLRGSLRAGLFAQRLRLPCRNGTARFANSAVRRRAAARGDAGHATDWADRSHAPCGWCYSTRAFYCCAVAGDCCACCRTCGLLLTRAHAWSLAYPSSTAARFSAAATCCAASACCGFSGLSGGLPLDFCAAGAVCRTIFWDISLTFRPPPRRTYRTGIASLLSTNASGCMAHGVWRWTVRTFLRSIAKTSAFRLLLAARTGATTKGMPCITRCSIWFTGLLALSYGGPAS